MCFYFKIVSNIYYYYFTNRLLLITNFVREFFCLLKQCQRQSFLTIDHKFICKERVKEGNLFARNPRKIIPNVEIRRVEGVRHNLNPS